MAETITKKIQIDTNQATANIDKLSKSLDKASNNADDLNQSLEQTSNSANTPLPTNSIDNFGNSLEKAGEKAETFRVQTDNVQKISAGLTAGFQMAVGAIALFGDENEKLTQIMQKLSAVMVMTNSLKALGEGFKGLADYVKIASKEGKLFNNVMKASVIGIVVAAVGYLIANFDELRKRFGWLNTAATKCEEVFDGLSGVFSNIIPVIKNLGKTIGLALIAPIRTIIDGYEAIGKIIKAVFTGDFDQIPSIAEEALKDIKENFTDVGDAAKELGNAVAEGYAQGVEEGKKPKLTDEQKEAIKKAREEQAALAEELRRARLDEKQKEYDDLEIWNKKAREQAHGNKELLLQIEEEYRKRKLALDDKYDQIEKDKEAQKAADEAARLQAEKDAKLNDLNNQTAENKYNQSTGEIDNVEYDTRQLEIEQQKLALIEEGTTAYYAQLQVIDELNKKLGEDQAEAMYEASDAWGKWKSNSAKSLKNFKKDWDKLDMAGKMEVVSQGMTQFGSALNDMFGSIMSGMDENSEAYRGLAITQTVISMLMGIVQAISSAFSPANEWMTIYGQIAMAATTSASVLAAGIASIAQIKSANENSNPSAAGAAVATSGDGMKVSEQAVTDVNSSYSMGQSLAGAQGDSARRSDNKTYVLTTDIQKKDKQLNNKRTEVKF